jgi:hypothetical protein
MIVSLEAIFLSTFVIISQNLAGGARSAKHWPTTSGRQCSRTSSRTTSCFFNQIMELTKAITP